MSIEIKRGEVRTIQFTFTDADGNAVNIESATLDFVAKEDLDDSGYAIQKSDSDFSNKSGNTADLVLDASDTNLAPAEYIGEVGIDFGASSKPYSATISITILKAVHNPPS